MNKYSSEHIEACFFFRDSHLRCTSQIAFSDKFSELISCVCFFKFSLAFSFKTEAQVFIVLSAVITITCMAFMAQHYFKSLSLRYFSIGNSSIDMVTFKSPLSATKVTFFFITLKNRLAHSSLSSSARPVTSVRSLPETSSECRGRYSPG